MNEALTHRSYINERPDWGFRHNEKFEFLGDAVLELIITEDLIEHFKNLEEGDLTMYRSALVNATTCAAVATRLGVNDFLILSRGESKDIGRARQYILANTLEAIIGALYLDQGYNTTKEFVARHISPLIEDILTDGSWMDSKSRFQERAQDIEGSTPSYKTIKETGPDHDKRFTVGVFIGAKMVASGEGESKQDAEQEAARKALGVKSWD